MAIEGTIQALLASLVSGRCYPLVNTSATIVKPYITYQVVSNVPTVSLTGPSGLENRRVQIDIWSDTYGASKALEIQVKAAMNSAPFVNIPLLSQDFYEEETKLYRVSVDFSVWS